MLAEKEKKALKTLDKLLKAAKRAQESGKVAALKKIITEAGKLSEYLDSRVNQEISPLFLGTAIGNYHREQMIVDLKDINSKEKNTYTQVMGELV